MKLISFLIFITALEHRDSDVTISLWPDENLRGLGWTVEANLNQCTIIPLDVSFGISSLSINPDGLICDFWMDQACNNKWHLNVGPAQFSSGDTLKLGKVNDKIQSFKCRVA